MLNLNDITMYKVISLLTIFVFLKIGEVVDGPEESSRPILDGIQYDYGQFPMFALHTWLGLPSSDTFLINSSSGCSVFDVDIGDGMPIRKLPYNRSGTRFHCEVFAKCWHFMVSSLGYVVVGIIVLT